MRSLILVAALVQAVLGGGSQVAVSLPYLNPAGVTYHNGPSPIGLAAGPGLGYAAGPGLAAGYGAAGYVGAPALAAGYAAGPALAAGYGAAGYAAAPGLVAGYGPAGYAGAPAAIGYAAAQVPAVAAVPTLHHVPGVADVPVTSIQAHPGVVQKLVDVARPAVSTRKFEVRRPAIQKQFYDIEERVVVRPAGSALVELDQPLSKTQRGPAVINPVGAVAAAGHLGYAAAGHLGYAAASPLGYAAGPAYAVQAAHAPGLLASPTPFAPFAISSTPSPAFIASTPAPPQYGGGPSGPAPGAPSQFESDGESVIVDNPDFSARSGAAEAQGRAQAQAQAQAQADAQAQAQADAQSQAEAQSRGFGPASGPAQGPAVEVRANGAALIPAPRAGPSVVPSFRSLDPHENQANQQRLIQLLTEQGGVAEVGFGRAGPSPGPVGDVGPVRARVLSATPAPDYAEPAGERVSTRRVVVSRPIETLQEIDVVEPVTKLHRIAVNHPTVFKTLRHDIARVHTSVPVLGKTLAPAIAHAAVPYGYYHH